MTRLGSTTWVTSLIAAGIALIITLVIPAGYFFISFQYMVGNMDTQAEVTARATEVLVLANPDTWQFEEIRLQEFLERHRDSQIAESRSVVDKTGAIIARISRDPEKPLVTRSSDIYDAGVIVGQVKLARSLRPLLVRTCLLTGGSAVIGGFIFLILRIIPLRAIRNERLKAEALLIQNRQLLKAESLGRMAAAIAHNFNNMLTAVIGNLELAILDAPPDSPLARHLTEAMKASQRATEVGRLMLTYLGHTMALHEPLNLNELCSASLQKMRTSLPAHASLEFIPSQQSLVILGNASELHHLLVNLFINAVESNPGNAGAIRLTIKVIPAGNIPTTRFPIDWRPHEGIPYACLEVADLGCGIDEKHMDKIFDPFFSTKFTGRGMGLPVVLGIIRAHDGAVSVKSEPGRGSIFQVFLPIDQTLPEKVSPS